MWDSIRDAASDSAVVQLGKMMKKKLFESSSEVDEKEQKSHSSDESQRLSDIVENDDVYSFGTVASLEEDFYVVNADEKELIVPLTNSKWNFIKGDKVRISGIFIESTFGVPGKMKVKSMVPAGSSKTEFGRVTSIDENFVVFEERIVMLNPPMLDVNQECKYVAIETDQRLNGLQFEWRVAEILQIIEIPSAAHVSAAVHMKDFVLTVFKSASKIEKKFLIITNTSSVDIKLMKCELTPSRVDMKLDKPGDNEKLLRRIKGVYKAFITIFPRSVGTNELIFTASFETLTNEAFQKQCKVTVDVVEANVVVGQRPFQPPRFINIRVDEYRVPIDLRQKDYSRPNLVTEELTAEFQFLSEDLSPVNYLDKMHFSIYIDEIALEQSFLSTYQIKRARFENIEGFLKLTVKDIGEKRPSIIVGDRVEASNPSSNGKDLPATVNRGYIYKVENDAVLLKFFDDFHESHRGKEFAIDFKFSRSSFKKRHHSIDALTSTRGLGTEFLFPKIEKMTSKSPQIHVNLVNGDLKMFGKKLEWYDKKLNNYQKEAVVNVLRGECRPMPYIIYGPPGTGKTLTVIELIMQLFFSDPSTHLIVATPSNSAANLFTQALVDSERFKNPHDFIRFVSNNQIEQNLIPPELLRYCATISVADDSHQSDDAFYTPSGIRKNCTKSKIINYRICISTLSCIGSMMQIKFGKHFTHVIIDEAGQSIEPETLIPMTLLARKSGQVILAGDPKQLGPISISRYVKTFNLDTSILERLLATNSCYAQIYGPDNNEYDPRFVTKLKKNYRSLPSVLNIYNNMFYNHELEGVVDDEDSSEATLLSIIHDSGILWNRSKSNKKCGVYFINVVNGKNRKIPDSCSWYNECEVNAVLSFLSKLSSSGSSPIQFTDIGVITPYSLQVKKLKQQVSVRLTDTDLKIGTVEEFQGQERQIILVSTVRTDESQFLSDQKFGLGFLQCRKRMNVAISRARALMVIFGKGDTLKKDERWKELIDYTIDNNTYFDDERQ